MLVFRIGDFPQSFLTIEGDIMKNPERLYSYAVIKHPTEEEAESGIRAEIIVPPSPFFLAKSENEAAMRAAKAIPDGLMDCADRLEVAVRPF